MRYCENWGSQGKFGNKQIGGAALRTALEPLAQPMGESDDRSLEHRQGDAIVELSLHSLDAGLVPQHASQRPHLQVTASLDTLRGEPGSPAGDMEYSLPVSTATVQRLGEMLWSGELAEALVQSLALFASGFFLAVIVAVPLGLLFARVRSLRVAMESIGK